MKMKINFTTKLKYESTSVPASSFKIFLATAPAATLPMVSLAEDLPPPYMKTHEGHT